MIQHVVPPSAPSTARTNIEGPPLRALLATWERRVWQQYYEETQRILPLPQAAIAAVTLADASAQMQVTAFLPSSSMLQIHT